MDVSMEIHMSWGNLVVDSVTWKTTKTRKTAKTRHWNWARREMDFFANILADEENQFATSIEKLVRRKTTNQEVFHNIQTIFDQKRERKGKICQTGKNKYILLPLKKCFEMSYLSYNSSAPFKRCSLEQDFLEIIIQSLKKYLWWSLHLAWSQTHWKLSPSQLFTYKPDS